MRAPIAQAAAVRHRSGPRHWLKRLHLWLGLSIGVVYALIALSGSILVLQGPLLRLAHPELTAHALPAPAQRAAVMQRIVADWSARGLRAADLPTAGLPVWQLYFRDGSRRYLDPAGGDLLLTRRRGHDLLLTLREWHTHLLGGHGGETLLGAIGWASIFLLASGIVLWWPGRRRLIPNLRPYAQPPIRRWLTWHRSVGALALPMLLLITLTGTLMTYHRATHRVLHSLLGGPPDRPPPARIQPREQAIDWRAVLDAAQRALPNAELHRIGLPQAGDARMNIRARSRGEWHPVGRSVIWLDPYTARVLARRNATTDDAASRLDGALYPLHSGAVGGWPWRLLATLAGLLPLFFVVTGLLFWRARTRRH